MKKLSTYLFLILFSFSALSFADDISEYQIEGINIGDSALDYLSKEKIITGIEKSKFVNDHLTEDFAEVYLFGKSEIYNALSFIIKPDDKNYTIYYISGSINYNDKIKQCYAKQKEIIEEFSLLYKNTRKVEKIDTFPSDPTGKSNSHYTSFLFDSGDTITVSCAEFEKSYKIKKNMVDGLSIEIATKKVEDWMSNWITK